MKAAYYEQLGNAKDVLKIGEIDVPELGANDVLVKVRASGINPSDVKQRSGWGGLTMRHPRVIPHNDGAGIIEAAGEGVPQSRIGERVWIYEATLPRQFGTAAEYVVVPSEQAVFLPENTDFAAGACLGVPAMTAHHCVFKDGAVTGKIVLVAGGAGAVGNYAIQLAKWGGATVISTVSSAEKAEIAKTAGADYIVNYKAEDVVARIKEIAGGKGVDRIIEVDFAGNLEINLKAIARNGTIATYASDSNATPQIPVYSLIYKNLTVHYVLVYAMDKAAHQQAAADITTCLKAGVLRHVIAGRFGLDEIAAAHELQESGSAIGNLVLLR
ncbi:MULTISPECIES: NADPH:quinone reductase [unclassified Microcoleus]|uniref:NADPH:quinone reductase n=1 Tax=unclassified Microcoleus TaxID=2642155 RepID=UPI001D919C51|nr:MULTISPECIES: NADPH:quinone reductase [unclassified Microcoleus]MCC3502876.1 NADPH:quinone reductase [Microcoleus sp. PH2017_19_SFW_U_A]TAF60352.1 MAG: NADPH:quinone reductase [Oscillatoriales cyanobacterium]MCC3521652.1 NADPH:quinone reductase [Microcoleus sp. PH2017_20_SFW_D_A]MCC3552619.1 NADPH:quinone reductase [Microcoleus sp. PH2017_35_SFW_U_B]TAG95709.1 MAG: NADPH:quinone reductase [Oscillatoriales cyanobacterium]